jgi:glyoxylase-like metal-dependent hydrolase (beta-lactamase superfamily II)
VSALRIRLIRTGTVALPPGYVFRDGWRAGLGLGVPKDARLRVPIGAALIEHPSRGPVLVDTGMHPVVATDPARNLGRLGARIARIRMAPDEHVPARLREWGIEPDDVGLVVMTHLHPDHTSAMSELRRARFTVAREEWAAARSRLSVREGYIAGHLPSEDRVDLVDFEAGVPYEGFARTLDLLGDGTIRLVSTPGHTAGHFSVLVEDRVLLLGDAVYTLRNLHEDRLPWRTHSDEASRATMRELRAYAAAHPDVPLIPTHDAEVWERVGEAEL